MAAYSLLCVNSTVRRLLQAARTPATYVVLLVFGAMQGLIGCFQFSRSAASLPVAALGFCALILATCLLAGAGMRSPLGGLVPGLGWFLASFVLTLPNAAGSVIVTNTSAGEWYLYGGAVCAAAGIVYTFRWRSRGPSSGSRPDLGM
jgi:peptidoglycan/LPS O-acetylase OafA/YrhL